MDAHEFSGTHLVCDITAVRLDLIRDAKALNNSMLEGIAASGAGLCGHQVRHFQPTGMTAVYLLSESHASIHTYPEHRAMFVDIFTCGATDPQNILDVFIGRLGECDVQIRTLPRGARVPSEIRRHPRRLEAQRSA